MFLDSCTTQRLGLLLRSVRVLSDDLLDAFANDVVWKRGDILRGKRVALWLGPFKIETAGTAGTLPSSSGSGGQMPGDPGLPGDPGVPGDPGGAQQQTGGYEPRGMPSQNSPQRAPPATAGNVPDDIPDARDDDIIARQLREAAMNETDPELREKLWEEYRRYKGA